MLSNRNLNTQVHRIECSAWIPLQNRITLSQETELSQCQDHLRTVVAQAQPESKTSRKKSSCHHSSASKLNAYPPGIAKKLFLCEADSTDTQAHASGCKDTDVRREMKPERSIRHYKSFCAQKEKARRNWDTVCKRSNTETLQESEHRFIKNHCNARIN